MGEQIRWVLSVDEETVRVVERWERKFAPFADGNRSALVRLIVKLWDRAATDERVSALLTALQGLKVVNSQYEIEFPAAPETVQPRTPYTAGIAREVGPKPLSRRKPSAPSRLRHLAFSGAMEKARYTSLYSLNSTRFSGRCA